MKNIRTYEQSVNTHWLQSQSYAGFELSPQAISSLETVAFKCWADGGPAVGRARDMLTLYRANLGDTSLNAYQFPTDDCAPGQDYRFEDATTKPSTPEEPIETFTLYPNPTDKTIIVQYDGEREGILDFVILDASGKTVATQDVNLRARGTGVDVSYLPSGIYFGILRQNGELIGTQRIAIYR